MSLPQQQFTFSSAWSPNGGLCNECVKFDLEQSFARAFALYEGARRGRNNRTLEVYRSDNPNGVPYLASFHYVASLGNRLSHVSLCKLCNFLRQTIPEPEKGTYKLLAICTSESYLFEPPKKDRRGKLEKRPWGELEHNVFMAVVPEVPLIPTIGIPLRWFETELPKNGSIYRLTQQELHLNRLARPRDVGPKVNMNILKSWPGYCKRSHVFCAPKKPAGATLPGFRAINCTKKPPIVEERLWSEPYVALSYVWGTSLEDWPQTILDAVEVTKRLGEKYLWVDRLCINQSNLEEKKFLISKMDAIYEGAEFTIVAAEGDARSGLPGVMNTSRKPQPRVVLDKRHTWGANPASRPPEECSEFELLGLTRKEYSETKRDPLWLDLHRFGLKSKITFEMSDLIMIEKDEEIMKKYDISSEHLTAFQELGEGLGDFDEYMDKMKQLAQALGMPMKELVPHMVQQMGIEAGDPSLTLKDIGRSSITNPSRPEFPLPPGQIPEKTVLISTMEDPRVSIRNSDWATRGWTYQEGILSNRRLVFTKQQVYWECCGNTANESLLLLILNNQSTSRMANFMLSGIFDGDLHRVPELQYGYSPSDFTEVSKQIATLDSHIRAFTSRNLTNESDSLNAFLGIAARYSTNNGLHLLLGMPVLAGLFANGKPGLQDTFALSLSAWTHTAKPATRDAEMYVADCPRRKQFPSWTWAGWTGRADLVPPPWARTMRAEASMTMLCTSISSKS